VGQKSRPADGGTGYFGQRVLSDEPGERKAMSPRDISDLSLSHQCRLLSSIHAEGRERRDTGADAAHR
jgi:hypothetical protein